MKKLLVALFILFFYNVSTFSQESIFENFEGAENIDTWFGDDCGLDLDFSNPFQSSINTSEEVLFYHDQGGQYANVRFDIDDNFDLSEQGVFSLKIYVPSNDLIPANQVKQVSLKLQNNELGAPWISQSEIILPIETDQWLEVFFDFNSDDYINLDPGSLPPAERIDFNRVVIQVNGENNNDQLKAYIDDFKFYGTLLENTDVENPVNTDSSLNYTFENLVWADEFETDGPIDMSKWFHQTQFPIEGTWFNGEIQHYTNRIENTYVEDGILNIKAIKENYTDQGYTKAYTSARLNSKFAFTYGKVEIKAKLPSGVGTWPAIWTLGKNIIENGAYWTNEGFGNIYWPACGEIDIMEHWGSNQNFVQSAIHTPSSHGNTENKGGQTISTASDDFHIYSLEWTPVKMVFKIDGNEHYVYYPESKDENTWPFDNEQYLLLNFAIQGNIDPAFTEDAMEIDYVRVYEAEPINTSTDLSDKKTIQLYPNPVNDSLNIELPSNSDQILNITISSLDGRILKSYKRSTIDSTIQIGDLADLSSGIYLVSYIIDEQIYRFKFVK